MTTPITSDDVVRLVEEAAQIVDVLPRWEYDEEHLAGAISIPAKRLDRDSVAQLRSDRPVVVYCHDYL
ncbi:MAG: rhodanese-like domain-containing protein [Acidobacteria bacterium]|nr:rhodanese-like domain-containing protein [Acidobacteriota bacterium]